MRLLVRNPGEERLARPLVQKDYETSYDLLKRGLEGGTLSTVEYGELVMWVDDEGLLKQLLPSIVIKRSRTSALTERDTILAGPVVFSSSNEEGDTTELTAEAKEVLENMRPAKIGEFMVWVLEAY